IFEWYTRILLATRGSADYSGNQCCHWRGRERSGICWRSPHGIHKLVLAIPHHVRVGNDLHIAISVAPTACVERRPAFGCGGRIYSKGGLVPKYPAGFRANI